MATPTRHPDGYGRARLRVGGVTFDPPPGGRRPTNDARQREASPSRSRTTRGRLPRVRARAPTRGGRRRACRTRLTWAAWPRGWASNCTGTTSRASGSAVRPASARAGCRAGGAWAARPSRLWGVRVLLLRAVLGV